MEFFHRLNHAVRHFFGRALEGLSDLGGALVRPIEWLFSATFGRLYHLLYAGFERIDQLFLGPLWVISWPVRMVWRGLSAVAGAILRPIEWLFEATFGRIFRMSEGFDRIDHWLLGLLYLLTWPLRMVWRLIAGAASAVLPESVLNVIGGIVPAWFRFQNWLATVMWELAERLNLDGLMRWISWLTQPLWRPVAAVGGFLYAWIATRPYKQMLWGLPVLILLLPIIGAVVWGLTWGRESVAAQYRVAAQEARDARDFDRMRFYEQKLDQLGVDTNGADFKYALSVAEEGKLDEAYVLMQALAPEEAPGYVPAHHWILVRMLGNDLDVPNDERLRIARAHLEHFDALGIQGPDFELLWAIWEAQSGKLEEASKRLEPLIGRMQMAALQRFEIDLKLKNMEEARRDARALRAHFDEAKRRDTTLQSDEYMAWAQAEQVLGSMSDWGRVVREWLTVDPENKFARESVASLDLREFNEILQSPRPDAGELAKRLIEIATLSEKADELEPQVALLYRERRKKPALIGMIDQLIASPDLPPTLMAALGTSAALDGDMPIARKLLEKVVKADEKNAVAWNNLAWSLSQAPDRELDKALIAVNRALELTPAEFRFRETRGQILVLLERWDEAIADLEFALNGMPDAVPIHIALATAYEKLGQTELAEIHRKHAH